MPDGTLTESRLERFRDEGYLRIGALLDDELIGSLREEYDRVFAEARGTDGYRDLAEPDDVDVSNGAMHVLPGSHRQAVEHPRRGRILLDADDLVGTSGAVAVELPAGGVTFHHCQTFHSTPPNRTDRQRRAFAMHYMRPGTRSQRVGAMPVGFERPLLRLEPQGA